jgi:hypothetical protein
MRTFYIRLLDCKKCAYKLQVINITSKNDVLLTDLALVIDFSTLFRYSRE